MSPIFLFIKTLIGVFSQKKYPTIIKQNELIKWNTKEVPTPLPKLIRIDTHHALLEKRETCIYFVPSRHYFRNTCTKEINLNGPSHKTWRRKKHRENDLVTLCEYMFHCQNYYSIKKYTSFLLYNAYIACDLMNLYIFWCIFNSWI